ncbi:MAG: tetratricopeptide repeat protein [Balneolales bacterium]
MKSVKSCFILCSVLLITMIAVITSPAQTLDEAIAMYNEGYDLFNSEGDYPAAIEKFEETVALAELIGPEANDIRERAIGQIPRLALIYGSQLVTNRQFEAAIEAFLEAVRLADRYGDDEVLSRAQSTLPALYLNLGNRYYRDEDNEKALENYNKAIELNPSYVLAYYQAGLVYRREGDSDRALEHFDISIDLASSMGDQENMQRGQRAARDYLIYIASGEMEEERYSRALELLTRASGYGESANMYYRMAEADNFLGRHREALSNAQKALELETGGRADLARIYFELGLAHKGLDNTSAACEAFNNALFGDFRAPAEHEIEHELRCDEL